LTPATRARYRSAVRRAAALVALLSWGLVACADGDGGPDDLGSSDGLVRRSCRTTLVYRPGRALSGVGVAGEWNGFRPADTPMSGPDSTGGYSAELDLPAGVYAYKLVVTENGSPSWLRDPGNPYSKFVDGEENSALEVGDCQAPLVRFVRLERSADGALSAELQYVDGASGAGLGSLTVTLDGAPIDATPDAAGRVLVTAAGLARDKHRLVVRASDAAGRAARELHVPFWIEEEVFDFRDGLLYFVFTDRFRNGSPGNDAPAGGVAATANYDGGDFAGVREQIEAGYFDALGVRTLWISPPNANPGEGYAGSDGRQYTGYHGYWPSAGRDTQPRFGTLEELRALVRAAHRHGMRVVIDSVLNHVHRDHPLYAAHKTDGWFNGDGSCVCGQGSCDWDVHRVDCWFTSYLPDVNYQSWDATEAMIEDALFWARELDIDGFRVDAVKHFEHAATRRLRGRLRAELEHAGALYYLVGETFTGGDDGGRQYIKSFLGADELHAQFDFPIYWGILGALGTYSTTMRALEAASNATDATFGEAPMSPFFGNHDVPRFVTQASLMLVGDGKEQAWTNPPGAPSDSAGYIKLRLAITFVGTQPGVPLVYYGDEIGLPGAQDPDNRRPMKWDAHSADEAETLAHTRRVGAARRELRALRRGLRKTAWIDDDLYVYARYLPASGSAAAEAALVVINRSWNARSAEVPVPVDVALPDGTVLKDRLGGGDVVVHDGKVSIAIGAHTSAILAP
jgi:neopullulanase